MSDYTLPPLPAPFGALERDGLWNGLPREGHDDVYDAEQMTAYAEAARAPLLQRIAELERALAAQCGEPVAWCNLRDGKLVGLGMYRDDDIGLCTALYTAPPSQPAARLAALREVLQMFEAKLTELWGQTATPYPEAYGWLRAQAQDMESFNTAPPSQPVALPDGLVAVPREKLEQITDAIFSRHHNAKENGDAYDTGYFGKMLEDLEGMLAAKPEVPRG